jgi:uncharacterized protein
VMRFGKMITSNSKVLSTNERYCKSVVSQTVGLMFRSKQNLVMKFPTERRVSLHMFFVFFPIDVLVVDSSMKIVEIKKNFKPFTVWNSSKKGKYVIELAFPKDYKVRDMVEMK